ncbi:hypothetical protein IL306_007248 [Fusarium sp. DS 682]|nr:hypothetical protein IL306_007248 [Fusarium sp. DS 682]
MTTTISRGVQRLAERITMLQEWRVTLEGYLSSQKDDKGEDAVKLGARPAFYQQRDPTLVVGGVQSGWEPDYLDSLLVRLESQTFGTTTKSSPPSLAKQSAVKRLVTEFVALRPAASPPESLRPLEMPLFHDQLTMGDKAPGQKESCRKTCREGEQEVFGNDGLWYGRWNDSQLRFPLFLELTNHLLLVPLPI